MQVLGYDGAKRRKGAKVHAAADTLGHLLALHVTPAHPASVRFITRYNSAALMASIAKWSQIARFVPQDAQRDHCMCACSLLSA